LEARMKGLIGLQVCDNRIENASSKKKEGPEKIRQLEESMKEMDEQLEKDLNQLDESRREKRQTDQDIDDFESSIAKSNEKMLSIKSNKEYRAALKEIDDLKKQKLLAEDRVLEIMETIEQLENISVARKAEGEELKERVQNDSDEILKQMEALDLDLASLRDERDHLCEAIDEELLKRYDSLMEHRAGLAVSAVIKGVCQTCHLGLPPQKFNELLRGDTLMSCPNCHRIIYWGEDERYVSISMES